MSETATTWLKTWNKYLIHVKLGIKRGAHENLFTCVWLLDQCPFWLPVGSCDALLYYLSREMEENLTRTCQGKKKNNFAAHHTPFCNLQMNAWLTFNDTMLLQEGGRARQGVWCCGSSWGGSRRTGGRDVVTRRWVLTPISVDLHVQKQFILSDTPEDKRLA